jgi:hypothetical protein
MPSKTPAERPPKLAGFPKRTFLKKKVMKIAFWYLLYSMGKNMSQ